MAGVCKGRGGGSSENGPRSNDALNMATKKIRTFFQINYCTYSIFHDLCPSLLFSGSDNEGLIPLLMMEDMLGSFRGWKGEVWAVEGGEEEKNFDELFTARELSRGRRGE